MDGKRSINLASFRFLVRHRRPSTVYRLPLGQLPHHLAQHPADVALQVAHARLAGVVVDDGAQRGVFHRHFFGAQAVRLHLASDEVALGDVDFLVLDVAGELDHLHAVAQRGRHRAPIVGGGNKQHLREVEGQVQVMVGEAVVLLRVEHLQQRGGRVAAIVLAKLINLVEQDHRVGGADAPQLLDDPAGLRADVGAAEAPQLGFVAHAAKAHAHEAAAEGAGDALAQAGLAHAGRANKRQDGLAARAAAILAHGGAALLHGQILQQALFDLL